MLQAPGILDGEGYLVISTKVLNLIYPEELGVVKPQRLFYNADKTPSGDLTSISKKYPTA